MTTDIASLASPIDALYRIHNALRTEAEPRRTDRGTPGGREQL